jgi:hypothetical protein
MTLLDACLETPLALPPAADGAAVIDGKFRLAAALRAERSLQSWAITETARPEVEEWTWGAYRFAYGYQRADLDVRGPPVYEALVEQAALRFETLYTASGMSAIAAVVTGLLREHRGATVFAAAGGYSETRELLQSLGERVTLAPMRSRARRGRLAAPGSASARLLWVDSAAAGGLGDFASPGPQVTSTSPSSTPRATAPRRHAWSASCAGRRPRAFRWCWFAVTPSSIRSASNTGAWARSFSHGTARVRRTRR